MDITIPANSTAIVHVPAQGAKTITESGRPVARAQACRLLKAEAGGAVIAVGSGEYHFESLLPAGSR
jgi:alpha-L-rhamnosidase